jgi:hypothetical protein
MHKKVNVVGKSAERIEQTGRAQRRIQPAEFAAALGAEPCNESLVRPADPINLAEFGSKLVHRLRSQRNRLGVASTAMPCAVPLSVDDIVALEEILNVIDRATGTRPSLEQVAGIILRMHVEELRRLARAPFSE